MTEPRAADRPRSPGRPQRNSDDEVLSSALTAFAAVGYEAMSIRSLARELDLSHGALNQRFGSKDQLFAAAVDHGFGDLIRAMEHHLAELPEADGPSDALRNGLDPLSFIRYLGTLGGIAGVLVGPILFVSIGMGSIMVSGMMNDRAVQKAVSGMEAMGVEAVSRAATYRRQQVLSFQKDRCDLYDETGDLIRSVDELLRLADARPGDIPKADVLEVRITRLKARQALEQAKFEHLQADMRLNNLLGNEPGVELELTTPAREQPPRWLAFHDDDWRNEFLRAHDALNLRVGRFSPTFGEFGLRHDPGNHRLSDKPLPYDMGRMLRMNVFGDSVLPSPYVDNGIELSGTHFFDRSLQLDYAAHAVAGLRANTDTPYDVDFIASRSATNAANSVQ